MNPHDEEWRACRHTNGLVKVESKDHVIAQVMIRGTAGQAGDQMEVAEFIAASPKVAARLEVVQSERKTVHEWLNTAGIPREEFGKPLCLLRRLRIAIDRLP